MPIPVNRTTKSGRSSNTAPHEVDAPIPFWQTTDCNTVKLYHGDVIDSLRALPAKSVQCCVTSPPYWGLRDYGTDKSLEIGSEKTPQEYVDKMVKVFREVRRVLRDDGTLWLNLGDTYSGGSGGININSDKQRSNHGTMIASRLPMQDLPYGNLVGIPWRVAVALQADGWVLRQDIIWAKPSPMPESVRNRCTKAHEYIFLLTKQRQYYYDQEAIREPHSDPEAIAKHSALERIGTGPDNRPEPGVRTRTFTALNNHNNRQYHPAGRNKRSVWHGPHERALLDWLLTNHPEVFAQYQLACRNKSDVWKVASFGYPGAHFATYPPKLIEPCVLAGTSGRGCCAGCGAPWKRVVESVRKATRPGVDNKTRDAKGVRQDGEVIGNRDEYRHVTDTKTVGWEPGCGCHVDINGRCRKCGAEWSTDNGGSGYMPPSQTTDVKGVDRSRRDVSRKLGGNSKEWREYSSRPVLHRNDPCQCLAGTVTPCTVLDPFIGSGTTAVVAIEHGRRCVGIDLSAKYLRLNAIPRIEGVLQSMGLGRLVYRPPAVVAPLGDNML